MRTRVCNLRQCYWTWASLAALLLASSPLRAQAPADTGTVLFSKTVRLVEVDVIAKDKHGNPVEGLEAKDFILLDNGHAQKIRRCSVERGTPERASEPPSALVNLPSNQGSTFSNTHTANAAPTVILFDLLNTPWELQPLMKKQLLQSLTHLKPGTPIALLILRDGLTVVSDFTTSTISLGNATASELAIRPEGFGPPITARATGNVIIDPMIFKAVTGAFRADENERVVRTLAALNIISQQLGRIKGRKSLLWVTAGLSVTGELTSVQTALDKLNDANVAVYTLDARGVVLDPGIGAENDANDLAAAAAERRENERGDVLGVIAQSTGGIFYHNTNRLDGAISQAIEDRSLVYVLEYYPDHDEWQGKFHKLVVKTSRPGLRLRYRSGYLATPAAKPTVQDQQTMLAAIAASPLDYSGIRFSVEVQPGHEPSSPHLVLHVPAEELQWSPKSQQMESTLQIWFIQRRASGEDVATTTSKADWHLPLDAYQEATRQGVGLSTDVKLQATAVKVRVLLRDTNSGKVGTVDVPLESIPRPLTGH